MDSNKLLTTFFSDSEAFIERLNAVFLQLEREPENRDLIEQAFRWAHSLKSESSYMDYDGLTRTAGQLEGELEALRKGLKTVTPTGLDHLFSLLDECQQRLEQVKKGTGGAVKESMEGGPSSEASRGSWEEEFTGFEKSLLREARERGELLYQAICELDSDTPLKFVKAYLLINNLELLVNVIRIDPPLDRLKEEDFDRITFLFSSGVGEAEIQQALNVDQVSRVHLRLLRYNQLSGTKSTSHRDTDEPAGDPEPEAFAPAEDNDKETAPGGVEKSRGEETPVSPGDQGGPLRIAPSKVDQLMAYMDEMRLKLHRLGEKAQAGAAGSEETGDLDQIRRLMGGMESALREMRMAPLGESLGSLPRLVRDLGRKAGKESRFIISGGDIRADKRITDLLTEPLTHLIRNALDHGIETPEERRRAGKEPQGLITLAIDSEEDYLVFTVSDDGRGIRREDIVAEAVRQGLPEDPGADILHYLAQPGFSTCSEVSSLSGRGLGLDLISRRITKEAGGKLSMETREGLGTSFIIRIPKGFQPRGLLLFKSGGDVYALPSGTVSEVLALEDDSLSRDDGGGYTFSGLPLYTPQGRCFAGTEPPRGKTVLILSHLSQQSGLLIDEVLFEQEIPPDQMTLGRELQPFVHEIYLGGDKKDYLYLDPSFQV